MDRPITESSGGNEWMQRPLYISGSGYVVREAFVDGDISGS